MFFVTFPAGHFCSNTTGTSPDQVTGSYGALKLLGLAGAGDSPKEPTENYGENGETTTADGFSQKSINHHPELG